MVKKFKLHAIGNSDNFNYYIIDKKQEVIKELAKVFEDVFNLHLSFTNETEVGRGKWVSKKINFEKYKDKHISLTKIGVKQRIDLFFGDKRIFFIIHCNPKQRIKFNNALVEITTMPKPKKKSW